MWNSVAERRPLRYVITARSAKAIQSDACTGRPICAMQISMPYTCSATYGIVAESLPTPRVGYGLPFGATVWASDYVILPAAKLYEPIWDYDAKTLANDLSAHLVYGLATAATLRVLSPRHE